MLIRGSVGPWLASKLNDWWVTAPHTDTAQLGSMWVSVHAAEKRSLVASPSSRPALRCCLFTCLCPHVLLVLLPPPGPALPAFVESCCCNCKRQREKRVAFGKLRRQQQNMQAELLRRVLGDEDAAAGWRSQMVSSWRYGLVAERSTPMIVMCLTFFFASDLHCK